MPDANEQRYTIKELRELGVLNYDGAAEQAKDLTAPHGATGLLNQPGVRPDMWSTMPKPGNFAQYVPIQPSVNVNERREILTGQTVDTGTNPTDSCGDAPEVGNLKVGQIVSVFGEYWKSTQRYNITEAPLRNDYADVNRRIINPGQAQAVAANAFVPDVVRGNPDAINTPVGKMLLELGNSAALDYSYVHFQGDASKNNTQTRLGFIKEYDGLDRLIKTGYTDAVSGGAMPAADSQVEAISGALDGTIVDALSNMIRTLMVDAELLGLGMPSLAIVVNPRMKFPLIDTWACNYQTARCDINDNGAVRLDAGRVTQLREQMNTGSYLLIDGIQFPLLTDFGVAATENGVSSFTSDIMVVPLDVMGRPTTYLEYVPYTSREVAEFQAMGFNDVRVMNGGLYLMVRKMDGTCLKYQVHNRSRLILDTPFLAGRLDDITFTSNTPFRDPFQGSSYHKNGGRYINS